MLRSVEVESARLLSVLVATTAPTLVEDAGGRVLAVSGALAAALGVDEAALLGRPSTSLALDRLAGRRKTVSLGAWRVMRWEPSESTEEARATKTRFLAALSHDLRTPLNAILGTAERLRRGGPLEPERVHASALRIERNAHALLLLLDDLFDSTQLDEGLEIEPVPFALADLFRHVMEVARDVAEPRGVSLVLDHDPLLPERVLGDVRRLRQILGGLMTRGARRAARGRVTLRARRDESPEARLAASADARFPLRLEVSVEGSGDSAGESTRAGIDLLGRIASAIGGRLVCDERFDRCVLTLALPIAPASASLSRGEVRGQIARAVLRGRVLVVDDSAENRELLGSLVAAAGLEVDVVEDGEAALELAERKLFDLALVDLRMPGLDGFSLRAALDERARRDGEVRLPVVAVTADAVAGTRERCLAAGFADCVYKPIEGDALLRVVRRRLRRNVLVADDDGDLRALVAAFLEDAGWRVFSVDDGAQAVAQLADRTVHALVVDLEMPVLDGFGVIERARTLLPHVPVIALTGHRDPETRRRAQAAGFHEVLTKPLEGALLVERLRTLLP